MDKEDKDKLTQAIQEVSVKDIVKVAAHVLAKDDKACMEIAEAYLAECERMENE